MTRHEVATRRVLYEIPGMRSIQPRQAQLNGLPLEIYGQSPSAVILLGGLPDEAFQKHVGCRFMEMEWTISMAQLIAASGMTAITHSNRDALADGRALIDHLGGKVGVWSTSGHGPVVLQAAARASCTVLINPITKDVCPDTPLLVVRAGQDENPGLNAALDAFAAKALAENKPFTLVNYPEARHSFELYQDQPETRRILQQGLDFLRAHLM